MATSIIPYRLSLRRAATAAGLCTYCVRGPYDVALPFLEGLPVFAGCSWAVIGPFA